MTMKCRVCGCVGLTEADVHEADAIVGEGYETMCVPCAQQTHAEMLRDRVGAAAQGGKLIHCPDGDLRYKCIYCECGVNDEDEDRVPAVNDDAGWNALVGKHDKTCEWILTRAHQRPLQRARG